MDASIRLFASGCVVCAFTMPVAKTSASVRNFLESLAAAPMWVSEEGIMGLTPLNRIASTGTRSSTPAELQRNDALRQAIAGVRGLNSRGIPDREFSIVRDPASHKFVVQVVDR